MAGAMLAKEWDLDTGIILAIRLHHLYELLGDEFVAAEVRVMIAANLVVKKAIQWFRKGIASLEWQVSGDAAMKTLGLDHHEIEGTCLELKQLF